MKYSLFLIPLALLGCMNSKMDKDPGFTVEAQVHRHTIDSEKGIKILVFPIDGAENAK